MKEWIIPLAFVLLFCGLLSIIIIQSYELEEKDAKLTAINTLRLKCIDDLQNNNQVLDEVLEANRNLSNHIDVEKIYNPNSMPNGYDLEITRYPLIEPIK